MIKGNILFWIIMGIVAIFSISFEIARKKRLQKYWLRSCMGSKWRKAFPNCQKDDIRAFLQVFVDAFGFSNHKRLQFEPDDKVMDIYQAIYPPGSAFDSMELESFALRFERKYGIDLTLSRNLDFTLGQLFEMTKNPNYVSQAQP